MRLTPEHPLQGSGSYSYLGAELPPAQRLAGGWESVGDVGTMDGEGYLYLHDRRTDMILVGGANVYPAEIEAVLDAFPGVRSSAVVGLPDHATDLGNRVHGASRLALPPSHPRLLNDRALRPAAAIVDAAGAPLDEAALSAHVRARLSSLKWPRSYEVVTEPLRDDAGKVRRTELRRLRMARARL